MSKSGGKWSSLSIQERIRAMNETLDSVEHVMEDPTSVSEESSVTAQPTKRRTSVIDMWRKREESSGGSREGCSENGATADAEPTPSVISQPSYREEKKEDEPRMSRKSNHARGVSMASPAPPPLPTRRSMKSLEASTSEATDVMILASSSSTSSNNNHFARQKLANNPWEPFGDTDTAENDTGMESDGFFLTTDTSRDYSVASSASKRSSVLDLWKQRTSQADASESKPKPTVRKFSPKKQSYRAQEIDLRTEESFEIMQSNTNGSAAASSLNTDVTSGTHLDMPGFENDSSPHSSSIRRSSSWGESPVSPRQFPVSPRKAESVFGSSSEDVTSPQSSVPLWKKNQKDVPPRSPTRKVASMWQDRIQNPDVAKSSSFSTVTSPPVSPQRSIADRWKPKQNSNVAARWKPPNKIAESSGAAAGAVPTAAKRWQPKVTSTSAPESPKKRWQGSKQETVSRMLNEVAAPSVPPPVNTTSSGDNETRQPESPEPPNPWKNAPRIKRSMPKTPFPLETVDSGNQSSSREIPSATSGIQETPSAEKSTVDTSSVTKPSQSTGKVKDRWLQAQQNNNSLSLPTLRPVATPGWAKKKKKADQQSADEPADFPSLTQISSWGSNSVQSFGRVKTRQANSWMNKRTDGAEQSPPQQKSEIAPTKATVASPISPEKSAGTSSIKSSAKVENSTPVSSPRQCEDNVEFSKDLFATEESWTEIVEQPEITRETQEQYSADTQAPTNSSPIIPVSPRTPVDTRKIGSPYQSPRWTPSPSKHSAQTPIEAKSPGSVELAIEAPEVQGKNMDDVCGVEVTVDSAQSAVEGEAVEVAVDSAHEGEVVEVAAEGEEHSRSMVQDPNTPAHTSLKNEEGKSESPGSRKVANRYLAHVAPISKSVSSLLKEFGPRTPVGMASQNQGRWIAGSSPTESKQSERSPATESIAEPVVTPIGPKVSEIVKEHAARTPTGRIRSKSLQHRWNPQSPSGSEQDSKSGGPSQVATSPGQSISSSHSDVGTESNEKEVKSPPSRRDNVADRFKKRVASSKDHPVDVPVPKAEDNSSFAEGHDDSERNEKHNTQQSPSVPDAAKEPSNKPVGSSASRSETTKYQTKEKPKSPVDSAPKVEMPRKSNFTIPSFTPPVKSYPTRKTVEKNSRKPTPSYINYEADLRRVHDQKIALSKPKPDTKPAASNELFSRSIARQVDSSQSSPYRVKSRVDSKKEIKKDTPADIINTWSQKKAAIVPSVKPYRPGSIHEKKQQVSLPEPRVSEPPIQISDTRAEKPSADPPTARLGKSVSESECLNTTSDQPFPEQVVEDEASDGSYPEVEDTSVETSNRQTDVKNRKAFMNLGRKHAAKRIGQVSTLPQPENVIEEATSVDAVVEEGPFDEPPSPRSHSSHSDVSLSPRSKLISKGKNKLRRQYSAPLSSNDTPLGDAFHNELGAISAARATPVISNVHYRDLHNNNAGEPYTVRAQTATPVMSNARSQVGSSDIADTTLSTRRMAAEKVSMRRKLQSHRRRAKRDVDDLNEDVNELAPNSANDSSIDIDMEDILQPDSDTPVNSASPSFIDICETASSTAPTPSPLALKAEKLLQLRRRGSSTDSVDRLDGPVDPSPSHDVNTESRLEIEPRYENENAPKKSQNLRTIARDREASEEDIRARLSSVYNLSGRFMEHSGPNTPRDPSPRTTKNTSYSTANSVGTGSASRSLSVETSMSHSPVRHRRQKHNAAASAASEGKSVTGAWDPSRDIASLLSFDLKKLASAVDEQVSVIRDYVGGPQKSPSLHVMKSFECGNNTEVEDVAIEVEYIEGESSDDAASDLGVLAAPSPYDFFVSSDKRRPPAEPRKKTPARQSDMTPGEPSFEQLPGQKPRRGYV